MHYHSGVKVPAATSRLFENWFVWKRIKFDKGGAAYILGFVPLHEHHEASFAELGKEDFIEGETKGIYIITEVAPNVCRVTRIQTVDLHFTSIKKTIMDKAVGYLAKSQLKEADRLQEKFRRNGKKVDAEVRRALVERMKEGGELTEAQRKIFTEIEELLGGEEKGWQHLDSPYDVVKMKIKYKQQEKKKRSRALGQAECIADCTAEEAAAWYFEFCSRERMEIDRNAGNPARLEIRKGEERQNEKLVASVRKFPLFTYNSSNL